MCVYWISTSDSQPVTEFLLLASLVAVGSPHTDTPSSTFPYPVSSADHCETPSIAYAHIAPYLHSLPTGASTRVYDPYYCDGGVVSKLISLGFPNISHDKKDCYDVWSKGLEPGHDAFLTNPPYSSDHVEQLMTHLCREGNDKPWFLLMPQHYMKHSYYKRLIGSRRVFYVVPKKRYVYLPPTGFRDKKKSDTHKKSSPFVSMWFCWGGTEGVNERLLKVKGGEGVKVARSSSALRDLRRKGKK